MRPSAASVPAPRNPILRANGLVEASQSTQPHAGLAVASEGPRRLERGGQRPIEDDLVLDGCSPRELQDDECCCSSVRGLAYRYAAGAVGRLDLDLAPVSGDCVVPGRRRRNQPDVEQCLRSGLPDGTHEMTVQWELPAGVHRLQLLDDGMQLLHQQRRTSCPILVVDQPTFGTLRFLKHGLMMPVRLAQGDTSFTSSSHTAACQRRNEARPGPRVGIGLRKGMDAQEAPTERQ